MAADAGDSSSLVNWLIAHQRDVIWLVAIALGSAGWLSKRLRTRPLGGAAPSSRASDVLAGLRVALAAAQNAKAQGAPATSRAAARRPAPPPSRAPSAPPAPAAPTRPRVAAAASHPRRSPVLDAFRDPAGARTAVILAEILAPPVGLR